jgi:LacI family transcriptional regulator
MNSKVTLHDIAEALGLSLGTVHRALHGQPGVNAVKKARVLQTAKALGYQPNLAARYLRSKRRLIISVNTPEEIASFYDAVRAGVQDESDPLKLSGIELQHRTFTRLGVGEEQAFEGALGARVDGILVVPGDLRAMEPLIRRASRAGIPVVTIINESPGVDKLTSVSVDTVGSGALVAELMGRFLQGTGKVVITSGDLRVPNHVHKVEAFEQTLGSLFPAMKLFPAIQNHESEVEAYQKTLKFLSVHRDLAGLYISTGNGAPVLRAVEDSGLKGKLAIIATNIFPALVGWIDSGAVVGTVYERPYAQARIAFRLLHDFVVNGACPAAHVTLFPHLVMKSNLDRFLQREYLGTGQQVTVGNSTDAQTAAMPLLCY